MTMTRTRILALIPLLAAAGCTPPASTSPTLDPRSATAARQVIAIADDYLAAWREAFPEVNTSNGIPGARHDRLSDNSAAAERAWQDKEDRWLAEMRRINPASLIGRPEWVTYGLLREELEASIAMRACNFRIWNVSPMTGIIAGYVPLAQQQPVGTEDLRRQALARWRTFPHFVDVEIANLREGLRNGYSEPKVNVRRVIESADRLLATTPTTSPFFAPAKADSTPAFRQAFEALVANDLTPSVRRYRDYLANEYLPAARDNISITANPNGAACNAASIRRYTTLDLTPDQVFDMGNQLVAKAESSMRAITIARYGTDDVRAAMRRARAEPSASFHSRDEVVPAVEAILDRVRAAVPRVFGILPKAPLVVEPFPAFQEPSQPLANYEAPAEDGSRPGVFHVNLAYATSPGEKLRMEGLAFHEGIPGHHFQLAIAQERPNVHPLNRYLGNSAYIEGWAIYSETVADGLGLFSSDASRLRWLEDKVYEGATLVMEAGMHAKGWTRQQAIDYELAHTTRTPVQAAIDVDRRIGWPGQGYSYQVGQLEIRRLRTEAERRLGARFDVQAFHDRVLEDGTITLPMLRDKIARWLAATR
ncbi:MAG TPA: DUF885 domain-containing protein [Gemmatimonadaceae bacterium]|nr:DUF885 domain-containing protein [Gemmatimonadaceae bacterium]